MALALANELRAELHKIPSQKCNAQTIEDTVRQCWYAPMTPGGFHVVLADEADQMTPAAQLALLSKLDSTDPAPQTIWIFTANDTERLERRFLSRCKVLEFSSYGMAGEIAAYLDKVWHLEGGNGNGPDLARVVKESRNNVRDCLQRSKWNCWPRDALERQDRMKTYSTSEAASKIGASLRTLCRWLADGKIRPSVAVPMGGGRTLWRWTEADIARARKVKAAQRPGPKPKAGVK